MADKAKMDKKKTSRPALVAQTAGSYAGLGLIASITSVALQKIAAKSGVDVSEEVEELEKFSVEAWELFRNQTGYEDGIG